MKFCSKCKRELPRNDVYFYNNKSAKDKLNHYCRECFGYNFKNHMEGYKVCSSCKVKLPATEEFFYKCATGKYGIKAMCKECVSKQAKKRYDSADRQNYYQRNKKQRQEYGINYYRENRDDILKRASKYSAENRTTINRVKQIRRSRKKGLPVGLTEAQWIKIKEDFNNSCAYCGVTESEHMRLYDEKLNQEHFIPLSKGGEYTHNNIIPSCRLCNLHKHAQDFFQWYPSFKHYDKCRKEFILKYLGYIEKTQQLSIL